MNTKKINWSTILSAAACVGVIATAVLTAKETPKALQRIEDAKAEKHDELTKFETMQVAAPAYIPAIIVGGSTIFAIITSHKISLKQIAALTAGCAALKDQFRKYHDKVSDIWGKDEELRVREEISRDEHPLPESASKNDDLHWFCINDTVEDRYFQATWKDVLEAETKVHHIMSETGLLSFGEYLDMLGIEDKNNVGCLGWSIDMMCEWYGYYLIDFDYRDIVSDDPDTPNYTEISFYQEPACGYEDDTYEEWFNQHCLTGA